MAKPKFQEMNIKFLIPDEYNVRKDDWNPEDDEAGELIDSIKAQGVLEPVLARPTKGQDSKYPKGRTHSIVCGSRRWRASLEARHKTMPVVIRTDLDNIKALGISVQENLKRRSMDKIVTARSIGRMWDMLNGDRTYEKKMLEMKKHFGMQEPNIRTYLNICKLSKVIEPTVLKHSKIDTHSLSGIQTAEHWDKEEKEKAIEVLSKIEKQKDRVVTLSELKQRTKEDEDLDIEEAHEEYKHEVDETIGTSFDVYLNAKERKATKEAAQKEKLEINTLIKRNHVDWLKKEKWLK